MTTAELVIAILMFVIAGILILLSIRSFLERGSYIYASKEERDSMNKKPYYRQTAIVFCLLSLVFIIIGLSVLLRNSKIELFQIPVIASVIAYAVVSTKRINKQAKK